jgi:hypothetical protein
LYERTERGLPSEISYTIIHACSDEIICDDIRLFHQDPVHSNNFEISFSFLDEVDVEADVFEEGNIDGADIPKGAFGLLSEAIFTEYEQREY